MSDAKKTADPAEFDLNAWIAEARLPERECVVYSRPDLRAEIDAIGEQLKGEADARVSNQLEGQRDKLIAQLKASSLRFRLRALRSSERRAINNSYPMPDSGDEARIAVINERINAYIAAQCVSPVVTKEQIDALEEAIGDAHFGVLVSAMHEVNDQTVADAPFWRASSGKTRDS